MSDKVAIGKKLNDSVMSVMGKVDVNGFEKAYLISSAMSELKKLLTPEYMKPIMELQGSILGFKTDKDNNGGYKESDVKNVLIDAVLMGLQPYGNQFNIIAGTMYPTKIGLGHLLKNFRGLKYSIVPGIPKINKERTGASVEMSVNYSIGTSSNKERLNLAIRMNRGMGVDAIIGKATRKARAWLYSTITGSEVVDGDIEDVNTTIDVPNYDEIKKEIQSILPTIKIEEEDRMVIEMTLENEEVENYEEILKKLQVKVKKQKMNKTNVKLP